MAAAAAAREKEEEEMAGVVAAKRASGGIGWLIGKTHTAGAASSDALVAARWRRRLPPLPWLLLASNEQDGEEDVRAVMSLPVAAEEEEEEEEKEEEKEEGEEVRRTFYKVPMPEIQGMHCRGSAGGWVVAMRLWRHAGTRYAICFNPLTGSKLRLPRMIFPGCYFDTFTRFTLLLDPSSSSSMSAVAALFEDTAAVWRRGDESWKELELYPPYSYSEMVDAIFHKGSLYTINNLGFVAIFDYLGDGGGRILDGTNLLPEDGLEDDPRDNFHLVESCNGGHLLLVWWRYEYKRMLVYRLKFDGDKQQHARWEELTLLEDEAIFVGINQAMSVSTRHHPCLTPNAIYFSSPCPTGFAAAVDMERDIGVYHLRDGNILQFYHPQEYYRDPWMPPIWVIP